MTSIAQAAAFGGVVMLGSMTPGPDFAVVVRRSAVSGRGSGMAAALGIAAGVFAWVCAAATGVAALVAASVVAFTVIKVVGAAYLFYLGVKALRSAARGGGEPGEPDGEPVRGGWAAFREGLLCNALNPKAALFFVALMPQFLGPGAGAAEIVALAMVALAVNGVWFLSLANLVGALRRLFARAAVRRVIDALTGTAMIALGVRLAASRP
ncbi:LysE family transporter [Spongiactinospora sp. TRM90649]|uniref:LysE family translocator n=1 Tax=Spongiactinospora sp. TRM90649 TaxID=3031114 RepID=UPI0023F9CD0F|nr:LysE family transporter [Spongiactinospora sp. TRM90649]MDF5753769.1 LysE family transporter [Spongiactinospora sp. TRM90649]